MKRENQVPAKLIMKDSKHFALQVETDVEAKPMRPTHLILVLDNSGSMAGGKLESAKSALASFYQSVQSDQAVTLESSWMVVFNSTTTELDFTGRHYDQIASTLRNIRADGGTDFAKAVSRIVARFSAQQGSRFFVAFFTDGQVKFYGNCCRFLCKGSQTTGCSSQ